jgi:hypothetical protein
MHFLHSLTGDQAAQLRALLMRKDLRERERTRLTAVMLSAQYGFASRSWLACIKLAALRIGLMLISKEVFPLC